MDVTQRSARNLPASSAVGVQLGEFAVLMYIVESAGIANGINERASVYQRDRLS